MAKPRRRKTSAIQTFTVITVHHRPPDADARLARAARTCLAVVAEANAGGDSACERADTSKKAS
jgi:hypothetical protein